MKHFALCFLASLACGLLQADVVKFPSTASKDGLDPEATITVSKGQPGMVQAGNWIQKVQLSTATVKAQYTITPAHNITSVNYQEGLPFEVIFTGYEQASFEIRTESDEAIIFIVKPFGSANLTEKTSQVASWIAGKTTWLVVYGALWAGYYGGKAAIAISTEVAKITYSMTTRIYNYCTTENSASA